MNYKIEKSVAKDPIARYNNIRLANIIKDNYYQKCQNVMDQMGLTDAEKFNIDCELTDFEYAEQWLACRQYFETNDDSFKDVLYAMERAHIINLDVQHYIGD